MYVKNFATVLFFACFLQSSLAFHCNGHLGVVPDPDNCQCFYICNALGEAVRECCNRKELFDAKILNCNHEYLVNCGNRPKPGEKTTTTKRTTTKTTTTTTTPTTTTTTTTKPTTTATSTTTPLSTTSWEPSVDCDYDGQKLPYPGNCHKYYVCREWMKSSDFTVDVFDCGDWVFDPNQGSCIWPQMGDDLCPR